jgi:disulfide bond formation protein DsbB
VFSFSETLNRVFTGSGECADVSWQFLGLSMPAWALLCFIALALAGFTRNWLVRD